MDEKTRRQFDQTTQAKPIGEIGEDFIEWLCQTPFGRDFVFRGPKYKKGKQEKELCDLLILLDDTVIVIQVKTADRSLRDGWSEDDWANWATKKLAEGVSQVQGACTAIAKGLIHEVENDRQGKVVLDVSKIKHFYGIVVVDHPPLGKWGRSPTVSVDDQMFLF